MDIEKIREILAPHLSDFDFSSIVGAFMALEAQVAGLKEEIRAEYQKYCDRFTGHEAWGEGQGMTLALFIEHRFVPAPEHNKVQAERDRLKACHEAEIGVCYQHCDEVRRLREALERTLRNFELLLAGKPVRGAAETIMEARRALDGEKPATRGGKRSPIIEKPDLDGPVLTQDDIERMGTDETE